MLGTTALCIMYLFLLVELNLYQVTVTVHLLPSDCRAISPCMLIGPVCECVCVFWVSLCIILEVINILCHLLLLKKMFAQNVVVLYLYLSEPTF